ncbi:MAG: hypothetical protein ACOYB3_01510 [Azonexus sp.]
MDITTPRGMRAAVEWQTAWISVIKEGGVWAVPRSLTLIKIYHTTKTAVFVGGTHQEPDIVKVFEAMGWTCSDQEPGQADQKAFSA